jgi:hypothetical protein
MRSGDLDMDADSLTSSRRSFESDVVDVAGIATPSDRDSDHGSDHPDADALVAPRSSDSSCSSLGSDALDMLDLPWDDMSCHEDDHRPEDSVCDSSSDSMADFNMDEPTWADEVVVKGKADLVAEVLGGVIRYYAASNTFVASCACHGSRCRKTKSVKHKYNPLNAGQGRPLGLLCAWLAQAMDLEPGNVGRELHRDLDPPSLLDRQHARGVAMASAAVQLLAVKERPRNLAAGEPDEPLVIV